MKWQVKQKMKRIAALLLSFVLLFDALEISAPAPVVRAMEESFGAFCAVTSFAELPQELREQALPLGAQESEIELPGSLSVTANVLEALPKDTAPAQTENAAQSTVPTTPIAEIPEEEEVLDADAEPQIQVQPQTAPAAAQGNVSLTLDGVEEVPYVQNTIKLDGVQWRIDAERSVEESFLADEEHAGASYTYVAVLPKKDSAGNTVVLQEGAQLPEIHVSVEGEKDAEPKKETERVTEAESETEELIEAGETEIEEITEKAETETESETETETEIETEEETDAEKETGSDFAVENEEEAETETEMEMIIEAEDETESETEEPILSLLSLGDEPMMISEGDGTGIDLTLYITDVEFTWEDQNGIQWPIEEKNGKYEFPSDHTLGFKLYYHMPKGTVTPENNVVTYRLPEGFEYTNSEGTIAWGGKSAGKYTIKDGVITLTFDDRDGFFKSDTDFTGSVSFESFLKKESTGSSGSLKFKEDVDFTYTITEKEEENSTGTDSSFNAKKTGTWLDDHTLNYTVLVTSGKYGATNVTLKDKINAQVNNGKSTTNFDFTDIVVTDDAGKQLKSLDDYEIPGAYVAGTQETVTNEDDTTVTTVPYTKDGVTYYKKVITKKGDETVSEVIVPELNYYIVEKQTNSDGTYTYIFRLPDMGPKENYTITYQADLQRGLENLGFNSYWDSYTVTNSAYDSHDNYKDGDWQSKTNSWIKKYVQGDVKLDEKGQYEIGWVVELNPNHEDLRLDLKFLDTLTLPEHVTGTDCNLRITVTDEKNQTVNTVQVTDTMLNGLLHGSKTIGEILNMLGLTPDAGATTTNYKISIGYTTLVTADELPDGLSVAENEAKLWEGDEYGGLPGGGQSEKPTVNLQNNSLQKEAGKNVRRGDGTKAPDNVLVIPWKATVKMDSSLAETDGLDKPVKASVRDEFIQNLWVTQKYLKEHLQICYVKPDGTAGGLIAESYYTLYVTTDGTTYSEIDETDNKTPIKGFKVEFQPELYEKIAGKKLQLDYELFGDMDFMENFSSENQRPSGTFKNKVFYGDKDAEAEYTASGDYFDKESYVNWACQTDRTLNVEELPNNRIMWRVKAELSEFSLGKDITITDVLPEGLDLYSVSVQRDYGIQGKTDSLTKFEISENGGSNKYTLELYSGGTNQWDPKVTLGDITVTISRRSDGKIQIEAKIPKELIEADNRKYCFNLNVEAEIQKNADILDPKNPDCKSHPFKNFGSLTVGDEPRGEDSNTVTVENDKAVLTKDGIYTKSGNANIMHYTLHANPSGEKRLSADGKKPLTLVDTLEYEPDIVGGGKIQSEAYVISLVPGSVKAYYYNESGKKIYLPANGFDFSYTYEEADITKSDMTAPGKRQNKLTMNIPDGLAVYIEYDYELQSNQTKPKWTIKNSATLEGNAEWKDDDNQNVEYENSSAEVVKNFVDFYKVDADNYNITLPDAEFVLYEWRPYDGNEWTEEQAKSDAEQNKDLYVIPEGDNGCWVARHDDAENIQHYLSNGKGKLPIEDLTSGTLYWLKETNAPVGYEILDDYGEKTKSAAPSEDAGYYFYLVNGMEPAMPRTLESERIHELSGANTVYIPNKLSEKTTIAARKIWADGTESEDVDLTLYQGYGVGYTYQDTLQGKNGEDPKLTPVEVEGVENPKTIKKDATGSELTAKWENLPAEDDNGSIYYYVFETKAGATPHVLEDGSYFIDGYDVEYGNNIGLKAGIVTVTNSRTSISAKKVWAAGATPVGVEFTLYQSKKNDWTNEDLANLFDETSDPGDLLDLASVKDSDGNPIKKTITVEMAKNGETVSWDNLPVADEEGNLFYYYVFETKAGEDGTPRIVGNTFMTGSFEVSYDQNGLQNGMVTVTNTATNIGVEKRWERVDEADQNDIEVQLYQSFTKPEPKVEGEKEIKVGLNFYAEDLDNYTQWNKGTIDFLGDTYLTCEILTAKSDTVKIAWEWLGYNEEIYSKLKFVKCDDPDVHIKKLQYSENKGGNQWGRTDTMIWEVSGLTDNCNLYFYINGDLNANRNTFTIENLESQSSGIQLPKDATPVEQDGKKVITTLKQANNWKHTWENLPQFALDSEGHLQPVYYYVKETEEVNYSPKYTYDDYNEDGSFKFVTITNSPKKETNTDITVEKQWFDAENNVMEPGADWTVTLQLWQQQSDGNWAEYSGEGFESRITLPDAAGEWLYTWEGLPLGKYYVEEVSRKDGFNVTYKNDSRDASVDTAKEAAVERGKITITNTEQRAEIIVEKKWKNAKGEDITDPSDLQVQMKLYRSKTPPEKNKEPDPGTGTQPGAKGTVKLIIDDAGYYNREPAVEAKIEADCATIRIKYPGSAEEHDPNEGEFLKPEKIEIHKDYPKAVPGESGCFYREYKISGLLNYVSSGCEIKFTPKTQWPYATVGAHEIIFDTTTPTPPAPDTGEGDGDGDENTDDQVLPKDAEEAKVPNATVTLNSDNNWNHTWSNLPQYDSGGDKLYYYVEELNTSQYKSTEYTYDYVDDKPWNGIEKVTVTNTLPDEPLSTTTAVKVTKRWEDHDGTELKADAVKNYQVKVQLQQRPKGGTYSDKDDGWSKCDEIVLKQVEDNWTHTWSDLEWQQFDTEGNKVQEYEYRVQELGVYDGSPGDVPSEGGTPDNFVENFEASYEKSDLEGGGFEFTITNTKKKPGIILPSTGSKYPWIFYGIGTTFLLIALAWMSRALKKSYIPSDTGKGGRQSDE